jgi:hypothetical protein
MSEITVKRWKDGHILIEASNWECFLRNEWINPMINWLNLNRQNIGSGVSCEGNDKTNDVVYISVNGNLMIRTGRDVVFLSKAQREELMQWLRDHKDVLSLKGL